MEVNRNSETERGRSSHRAVVLHALDGLSDAGSNAIPDGVARYLPQIIVKDLDGRYEEINYVAARELRLSHGPAIAHGKTDYEFFSATYCSSAAAADAKVIESRTPILDQMERRDQLFQQETSWILTSRYPRFDERGTVNGVVVVSIDLTVTASQADSALSQLQVAGENAFGDSAAPLTTLARARRAMVGADVGMWDRDLQTGRLAVSRRWMEMLGMEGDAELSFDDLLAMVHPEDRDRVRRANDDHLSGKTAAFECEFRIRHAEGNYRWIHSRGRAMRDAEGRPLFFSGSHTDVTDRVFAQQRLNERERFIRKLVDTDRSMIFVKDGALRYTFVNQALADFYGTTKHNIVGKTDSDFSVTEEQRERSVRDDREVLDGKDEISVIEDVRGADGSTRWFRTTKIPFEVDGERHVLGVAIDITRWYQERERREQQREELRTIMQLVPLAIHLKDLEGKYTQVNRAFLEQASKQDFSDVIGKTAHEVFSEEAAPAIVESDEMILGGAPQVRSVVSILGRSYELLKLPRHDAKGRIVGILGVSREITDDQEGGT